MRRGSLREEATAGVWAALPERVEATDSSGTVHVSLGPDGLPVSMHVGPGWRRGVGPEGLGSAVAEACRSATAERIAAWARMLEERGWPDAFERPHPEVGDDGTDGAGAAAVEISDPAVASIL